MYLTEIHQGFSQRVSLVFLHGVFQEFIQIFSQKYFLGISARPSMKIYLDIFLRIIAEVYLGRRILGDPPGISS